MLPASAKQDLIEHLKNARRIHEKDFREGAGRTKLPDAIARKYPNADSQWGWQFVFPAGSKYFDREAGMKRRHHLDESVIQKAIKEAVEAAGITKHGTAHSLRHSFATQFLENGYDIRTVQGTSRACQRFYDSNLHACSQSRPTGRCESGRHYVTLPLPG